jgi:3-deoxy-D-manno-octulosonate 8-phosphate phosphatase (KDO 8-P phosphatase)
MLNVKNLEERAKKIRLLCTDVDGVLTTGALHYCNDAMHNKSFNVRDGAGIKWLQNAGIPVALISGLYSPATINRATDLHIADCIVGASNKKKNIEELCNKYNIRFDEVAYVGDDLMDLPVLNIVGLACCPQDAAVEVQMASHWTVPSPGGMGVIRIIAETILKTQGHWKKILDSFV